MISFTITFSFFLCIPSFCSYSYLLQHWLSGCYAAAARSDLFSCIRNYWRRRRDTWWTTNPIGLCRATCFTLSCSGCVHHKCLVLRFTRSRPTFWVEFACLIYLLDSVLHLPKRNLNSLWKVEKKEVWNHKQHGFVVVSLITKTETYRGIWDESSRVMQTLLALLYKQ